MLGLDGRPAGGVLVRAFLVSDQGGGIISEQGAGLIANNGAGVVANSAPSYALRQAAADQAASAEAPGGAPAAPLETHTAADGTFTLSDPQGRSLNIEAEADGTTKAIKLAVTADSRGFDLQLAPTGAIRGVVRARDQAAATNLAGVDVFIPGTRYLAKTDEAGQFLLDGVPVGTFRLLAGKIGLGEAAVEGIAVRSRETTAEIAIALTLSRPAVSGLSLPGGGPGEPVVITGEHFGAAAGAPFSVTFGGAQATNPKRLDDRTIEARVPRGGATGDVVVSVNGVAGAARPFAVYEKLALTMGVRDLLLGETLRWSATVSEAGGVPVDDPAVRWTAEGEGTAAQFKWPSSLAVYEAGVVYLADNNYRIRTLTPTAGGGFVSATLVGNGAKGTADGQGEAATIGYGPLLTLDGRGGLWVADNGSYLVRRIALTGPDAGKIVTVAGSGARATTDGSGTAASIKALRQGLAGPDGSLYAIDYVGSSDERLRKVTPAGEVTTLGGARGFTLDAAGNALAIDNTFKLVRYAAAGAKTELAGSGSLAAADGSGTSASFQLPLGLQLGPDGTLYLSEWSDYGNDHRVRRIRVRP